MDQHLACNAAQPDDMHSTGAASEFSKSLKDKVFDRLPPATIVAVVLFWALAPQSLVKNGWTFVVAGSLITAFVQMLEWFHERHAGWRLNRQEFFTDLFYVILGNTVIAWTSKAVAEDPLIAAKQSLGITTHWIMELPFLVQVVFVIIIFEFGQYWMHRLMHNNSFFWSTHAPHHHITQLNAMKGSVGNPLELLLISLGVVALFDVSEAAVFCAFNVLSVIATFAHANVRADPPAWYGFFFTTIRNHSLHHTALSYEDTRCNYGNSLILYDRIFGTYKEGESAIVGQDERRRLSIWEQTIFPAKPLIEWAKARNGQSEPTTN